MRRIEPMSKVELEALTTKRLNALRKAIYKCGYCANINWSGAPSCYHPDIDVVKEILATREHIERP